MSTCFLNTTPAPGVRLCLQKCIRQAVFMPDHVWGHISLKTCSLVTFKGCLRLTRWPQKIIIVSGLLVQITGGRRSFLQDANGPEDEIANTNSFWFSRATINPLLRGTQLDLERVAATISETLLFFSWLFVWVRLLQGLRQLLHRNLFSRPLQIVFFASGPSSHCTLTVFLALLLRVSTGTAPICPEGQAEFFSIPTCARPSP